jgi:hypothetical protein
MQNDQNEGQDQHTTDGGKISLAQFRNVEAAAKADGVYFDTWPPGGGPPHNMWQKDHILVRGNVNEKTHSVLRDLGAVLADNLDGTRQVPVGDRVKLLKLENTCGRSTRDNRRILAENGVPSLDNNLIYIAHTDGANICPADEPTPMRPYPHTVPYPSFSSGDAGRDVRVTVIDTGLSQHWEIGHPWLYDSDREPPTEVDGEREPATYGAENLIQPDAGHGTFIAGIIRCIAPRARVWVTNTMRWAGAMTEYEVARAILAELDSHEPPDIINLSGGCLTPGPDQPGAMVDVMNRLRDPDCRTLLVAAAGNDGTGDHWFFPAAFAAIDPFAADDLVVAVGALREDRRGRACFSNYGEWVTLYEDGEKLVNAFPTGKFRYKEPLSAVRPPHCVYHQDAPWSVGCTCVTAPAEGAEVHFRGMAAWSGTSFATPIVVGRVVRHMTENPQFALTPRAAMKDLFKQLSVIEDANDSLDLRIFPQPVV